MFGCLKVPTLRMAYEETQFTSSESCCDYKELQVVEAGRFRDCLLIGDLFKVN